MQTSAESVYLDSSALVKLVEQEAESLALQQYLISRPYQVSCALARVELIRAVARKGDLETVLRARQLLPRLVLIDLDENLLDDAATLAPSTLRSLDAIHLAAARSLGRDMGAFVTYDARLAVAARQLGFTVDAPGR